ncbi:MAG: extracellular solute-binding protein, partial [Spartobacteria bacterium]|nr:extracellular solute-binding protein [Spartobacteria bacterium]
FSLPDPGRTDTATRADAAAVKAFVAGFPSLFQEKYRAHYEAHPEKYGRHNWDNVRVELHQYSGIQVEGVENSLLAIAGKVSPDVMYVNFRMSYTYIEQGFLYPLDNPDDGYLSDMTEAELSFRINPKIWPVIRRKGPDGATHVWAMPYGGALGKVVLYRKDLFDEADIPYPSNDWTWDDFYNACKGIADPGRGIYGIHFSRGKHESWWWLTFLWSAGGDVLVQDPQTGDWRAVFDTPEAAVALDFYNRLCTEPWVDAGGQKRYGYAHRSSDWGTTGAKWTRGEIGMMVAYIDEKLFQRINPDVTGMVPVPIGPTGERGAELNSMMMGLFSGIKDPAVRDAAWEYMKYYDSKEATAIKTKVMVEGGLGRFINPRYLEMFGYPELIRLAPKGWKECFEIAIATGRPEPYGKNCNYAYNLMTTPIQEAEELSLQGALPHDRTERLTLLQGLLQRAVARANEEMLGIIPPRILLKRRITAACALATIILAFAFGIRKVNRAFTPPQVGERTSRWAFRRYAWGYVLLLPAVLTIVVWAYIPLLRGSVMAFQDYRIMGGSTWVWLDNFGDVLWDGDWWASVWNALRYSVLVITMTFLPPVILAILLQEIPHGKILFRTIYYLPAVMSGLVVILLWKSFYAPSENGVLNRLLMHIPAIGFLAIGGLLLLLALAFSRRMLQHHGYALAAGFFGAGVILFYLFYRLAAPVLQISGVSLAERLFMTIPEPFRWLGDSRTAMFSCVLPMVWAGMGPGCLIYLAALKGIPDELYEAADMDGATFIDKILFVVFPMLKPLLIINFVGVFIASWMHATSNILAMTGGASSTEVAGLHIFYKAFIYLKFGPATAMAWVLACMLIGFTVYQLQILSRLEFKTTGDAT